MVAVVVVGKGYNVVEIILLDHEEHLPLALEQEVPPSDKSTVRA